MLVGQLCCPVKLFKFVFSLSIVSVEFLLQTFNGGIALPFNVMCGYVAKKQSIKDISDEDGSGILKFLQ